MNKIALILALTFLSLNKGLHSRMFDPNAMPNSYGLWLDAEALYWQSDMGSMSYGIESKSTTTLKGSVKNPHFDWNWGYRLGLGSKLPHDKWDLLVTYTYMLGQARGNAGGHGKVVYPTWAATNSYADRAKANWWLHLNMADAELGRNCFAGKWLSIRPFIGVRGLVIDQNYTVKYFGGTDAPFDVDKVGMDSDFWGVGLRLGFDTLWGLGKGFGIYGNGSGSLLSGHFDVHEKEKVKKAEIVRFNVRNDVNNLVAVADLSLGMQWDYLFSKDRFHIGVKFGWEFNIFFDQNQLFNFQSTSNGPGPASFKDDDLTFQGLTMGLRFDF